MDEETILKTATIIFSGMLKNNSIEIRFWKNEQGDITILYSTTDSKGNKVETNTATLLSDIIIGLKNAKR